MLTAKSRASNFITKVVRQKNTLLLISQAANVRLIPVSDCVVRIICVKEEDGEIEEWLEQKDGSVQWNFTVDENIVCMQLTGLLIKIDRASSSISYYKPDGTLLLKERKKDSRTMEAFQSYRVEQAGQTTHIQTADGVKTFVKDAVRVPDKQLYHTRMHFEWQQGEALYGLGQQEEGVLNLRGHQVYLHQANRKIAIPLLVSSLGYGILINTSSTMIFSDTEYGSYLYTEAVPQLDFYFINGEGMDGVVREYRRLTGKASMLPRWAFGYLQSQERYESQKEICQVAKEYRRRGIGLDGIVLDWCSWEDGMWGQKSFDHSRFPDPSNMIQTLHDEDVHFMISIWPNMDPKCENHKEMKEKSRQENATGNRQNGDYISMVWMRGGVIQVNHLHLNGVIQNAWSQLYSMKNIIGRQEIILERSIRMTLHCIMQELSMRDKEVRKKAAISVSLILREVHGQVNKNMVLLCGQEILQPVGRLFGVRFQRD